jgi:YVTN family beta-propeller protein
MVYVVNLGSNSVSVIDGSTNRVVSNVTVGCRPVGVTYDSSNKLVYVTSFELCGGEIFPGPCEGCGPGAILGGSVSIINASVENAIKKIAFGAYPSGVTSDSSGMVYVAIGEYGKISVIDSSTNSVVSTISVAGPGGMVFDSSNGRLYVQSGASNAPGRVAVIDPSTRLVVANITVGAEYLGQSVTQPLAFDSSNKDVYVVNSLSDSVSVIDGSTNAVTATIPVGSYPSAIAFDSVNGMLYVCNTNSNTVSVVDGSTNSVVSTVAVGAAPDGIAFDSKNKLVYVANDVSGTVSIISPSQAAGSSATTSTNTLSGAGGIPEFPYQLSAAGLLAAIVVVAYALVRFKPAVSRA